VFYKYIFSVFNWTIDFCIYCNLEKNLPKEQERNNIGLNPWIYRLFLFFGNISIHVEKNYHLIVITMTKSEIVAGNNGKRGESLAPLKHL
jgi:hypothetical protein